MKYSPEFLAQKAVEMRGSRCPVFNDWQLRVMFRATVDTLKGAPETGWGLGGGPKDPELKKVVVGGKSSIPIDKFKETVQRFGYGSFHTHPPPWDWPFPVIDVEKAIREGDIYTMGPSYGDMLQAFEHQHQVICIGSREEEQLGGETVIKCWTSPEPDQIDWWDRHIWDKIYKRRDLRLEYDKSWTEGARQEGPFLIVEHHEKMAAKRRKLKPEMERLDREIERDLLDYWGHEAKCVYKYPELPTMVGKKTDPMELELRERSDKGWIRIGYSSHGNFSTLGKIRDIELERGNYFPDLKFLPEIPAIWITRSRTEAAKYVMPAGEIDEREPSKEELEAVSVVHFSWGARIVHEDGDGGYLVVDPGFNI